MKKVLSVIPFRGIYPPMNGGMLRCTNLLNQLAKYTDLTVIMHQDLDSFGRAFERYPALKKTHFISTAGRKPQRDLFSLLPVKVAKALRYRLWNRTLSGNTNDNYLEIYPSLVEALKMTQYDYVILEDMEVLSAAEVIRRMQPRSTIIYNAYNVNTRLAEAALKKGLMSRENYEIIKNLESGMSSLIDVVFACSDIDLKELIGMNKNGLQGVVIPNGVEIEIGNMTKEVAVNPGDMLFCGSMDYLPNREGLLWFCRQILPLIVKELPHARLVVVGKGNAGEELQKEFRHPAVDYVGMVDDLGEYYKRSALAIIPLLSGSGTRLKLLEAMAYRTPVVSTSIGSEGVAYTADKNIFIGDTEREFAQKVITLINNRQKAQQIADEGYRLVEDKYDWNIIGRELKRFLESRQVRQVSAGAAI